MSERHVIHHRGSPRPDPSSGDDNSEIIWWIGGIAVVSLIVISFWQVILVTTLALATVGGLGAYIWKIQKHAVLVKKELFLYERKQKRVQKKEKNLEILKSRKQILSEEDYEQAMTHAREEIAIARANAKKAANAVCTELHLQKEYLNDVRIEVLKRASKTKEEKIKRALANIDSAIDFGNAVKDKLRIENS